MKRFFRAIIVCVLIILSCTCCQGAKGAELKEYLSLGQKYFAELNYEKAIIAYSMALEDDPKNVEAYQALADIYETQGDMDKAVALLEKAVEELPSNEEVQEQYERIVMIAEAEDSGSSGGSKSNDGPSGNSGSGSESTGSVTSGVKDNSGNGHNTATGDKIAGQASDSESRDPLAEALGTNADGWVKVNDKWYFFEDGKKKTGWMVEGDNWYYLDAEGVLQHGRTLIDRDYYFFNGDGVLVAGWQEEDGKWYFFGADGKMLKDQWVQDTFYVDSDGVMLKSTTTPDGQEVDAEGRKIISFGSRNAAYRSVIEDLEKQYGIGTIYTYSQGFDELGGVCYAKLVDFDNDGNDELYVVYHNGTKVGSMGYLSSEGYISEVYAFDGKQAKKVFTGGIRIDNGGGETGDMSFLLEDAEHHRYVLSGEVTDTTCDLEAYGYDGSAFYRHFRMVEDFDANYYNDVPVSYEEFHRIEGTYNSTSAYLSIWELQDTLQTLAETKELLKNE